MTITDKLQSSPPSRELDAEIGVQVLGLDRDGDYFFGKDEDFVLERDYYSIEGSTRELPHFTTSIDAALTLLPDGWDWTIDNADRRDGGPVAFLDMVGPPHSDAEGKGETPALALCIAILKARGHND